MTALQVCPHILALCMKYNFVSGLYFTGVSHCTLLTAQYSACIRDVTSLLASLVNCVKWTDVFKAGALKKDFHDMTTVNALYEAEANVVHTMMTLKYCVVLI